MDYREFLSEIERNQIKPVYLVYGREKYLVNSALRKLKGKYIDESFESLNYIYMNGAETGFEDIKNANETLPFMAEKKMVVVEDWKVLAKKKEGDSSEEESFIEYIKTLGSSSILLLVVNAEKVDSRRKIVKEIGKAGGVVELNRLKEGELTSFIQNKCIKAVKNISRSCINEFIQYTGYLDKESETTLNDIEHEIEKLVSYVGERDRIESEDINKVVTKSVQSNIFKLVELLGESRVDKSLDTLDDIISLGIPTQKIIYMVIRQLRLLLLTSEYMGRGYSQKTLKDVTGIKFDFVINRLIAQTKAFGPGKIVSALELALELDRNIKTSAVDERLGIERLLLAMSR